MRRRYPKRLEVEGPPPNYGAGSDDSNGEESTDTSDEIFDSDDSSQSAMSINRKECRVDLPSLRVIRGSSEDIAIPREVRN